MNKQQDSFSYIFVILYLLAIVFVPYICVAGSIFESTLNDACKIACEPYQVVKCVHDNFSPLNPYKGTALSVCKSKDNTYQVIDVVLK